MNKTRSPRRWIKRIALSFILLFGLVVAFLIVERIRGSLALKFRINELAARGERPNVQELEPVRCKESDNAASAILALTNRVKAAHSSICKLMPPAGRYASPGKLVVRTRLATWSDADGTNSWSSVRETLGRNAELFGRIHDALLRTGWDDGFNYEKGFVDFEAPPLAHWRLTALILDAAALAALNEGHTEIAVSRLEDLLRLVRLQKNSPLIISEMVRFACAAVAWRTSWEVVAVGGCDDMQLARIQSAWEGMDFGADMAWALEMECAMSLEHFELLISSADNLAKLMSENEAAAEFGMGSKLPTSGFVLRHLHMPVWRFAWARQDQLRALNRWQAVLESNRQARTNGWASAKYQAMELDDEMSGLFAPDENPEDGRPNLYNRLRYLVSYMSFSVGSYVSRRPLEMDAQRQMMTIAVALQRYKLRHGFYPQQLNALTPSLLMELPVDSMGGRPFCYQPRTDGSLVLYSLGEDGRDDSGDFTSGDAGAHYQNMWDGKDAMWPSPASAEEAEKEANKK